MVRKDDWITELHTKEVIKSNKEEKDFYWEKGLMVMTEHYHIKRGECCGNNCRHCPYQPKHIKNNQQLR
tara:strand:+ start:1154 stop:1360 length:207 start_codon:yes stop_codon:yes gene_type:complete